MYCTVARLPGASQEISHLLVNSKGYANYFTRNYNNGEVCVFSFSAYSSGGAHSLLKIAEIFSTIIDYRYSFTLTILVRVKEIVC
jgi:hypothetical protein